MAEEWNNGWDSITRVECLMWGYPVGQKPSYITILASRTSPQAEFIHMGLTSDHLGFLFQTPELAIELEELPVSKSYTIGREVSRYTESGPRHRETDRLTYR